MEKTPKRPRACNGFTLLEILIAMFIFSIIVATIFGSYRAVFSGTEALNGSIAAFEMANNCLSRMVTDIRSAHIAQPPGYAKPGIDSDPNPFRVVGEEGATGDGNFPRLRFTAFSHVPLGGDIRRGIAEIIYYVQETEEDGYVLRRADHLPPYPEFEEDSGDPLLCEHLKALSLTYYDQEGESHTSWDSESRKFKYATPRAVEIKMEIEDNSVSFFFETMIEFPIYRGEMK